jgi:hypothetical protein
MCEQNIQCVVCGGLNRSISEPELIENLRAKVTETVAPFIGKPLNKETAKSILDALNGINIFDLVLPEEFYCTCRIGSHD